MPTDHRPHRVTLVVFEPAQLLDVTGPLEVFAGANGVAQRAGRAAPYAITLATPQPGLVATTSGVPIVASRRMAWSRAARRPTPCSSPEAPERARPRSMPA